MEETKMHNVHKIVSVEKNTQSPTKAFARICISSDLDLAGWLRFHLGAFLFNPYLRLLLCWDKEIDPRREYRYYYHCELGLNQFQITIECTLI